MNAAFQAAVALGSVGVLLALMAAIRRQARRAAIGAEVQRKLVHVATGLYAMVLPWLFPDRWPVYMLVAAALAALIVLRIPRLSGGLGAPLHGVERRSYGDFLLVLSVGLCFFLADGVALYYVLPIAVLTLADAAAALAGTTYGTWRFRVEDGEKSVEGTVVFFTVALLVALVCLMFLSALPPASILVLALMVAAFGTLVEAQSWRGFDNLFLPLGLYVFLSVHSHSSLAQLLGLAGLFAAAVAGFRWLGPRAGLTTHAARVHVVAMFLILAVTDVQNALMPGLVLVAHAWAAIRNPGGDGHGDLDIVAALGLFSFGWLALGNATGWNAVQFYGLTSMGLAMGLATLALDRRLILVPVVALLLLGLRAAVTAVNSGAALWAEPLWLPAALGLMLTAAAAIAAPGWFHRDRVLKLTVLALLAPVGWYAARVLGQGAAAMQIGGTG